MKHKSSGITIEASVFFDDDIRKYSPGVIFINSEGMKTNRMTTDPTMYSTQKEAEEVSFKIGKQILSTHISGAETFYFDQN